MADESDTESGRGVPEGLREAIEGAFAATEKTRDRAQDLTGRTKDRAQGLVDGVSKRGLDARGTLDGLRLVNRDELSELELKVEQLAERLSKLESESDSPADG